MDGGEAGWLEYLFKGMVGVCGLFLAAWSRWIMVATAKNQADIESVEDMIHRHELEDARTYVTELRFKDTVTEMKDTAKRTYEKIDQVLTLLSQRNQ